MEQKHQSGFTIVELLIYIGVLTLAVGAVVALILSGTEVVNRIKVVRDIRASATTSLERVTREIQQSYDIDETESSLDVSPGRVTLLSEDGSGDTRETEFVIENDELVVYEDGVLQGSLITDTVEVDSLIFRKVTHGATESLKIELTLSSRDADPERVDSFYASALLRGSY